LFYITVVIFSVRARSGKGDTLLFTEPYEMSIYKLAAHLLPANGRAGREVALF